MLKKLILLLFIIATTSGSTLAAITFTDGKWETSFGSTAINQTDAGWMNNSGFPDGLAHWSESYVRSIVLSDSALPGNHWTVSSGNVNEWYYNGNLTGLVNATYGPNNLTIGGVVQMQYVGSVEALGTIGSLTSINRGWGDNDSIGRNTIYIYSSVDPDSLTGKTVAFCGAVDGYSAGDSYSSLTGSANNPDGSGGNGYRVFIGDGGFMGTGSLIVTFPAAQKEVWIRWYMRHEAGFTWRSMDADKSLYLYTASMGYEFEARSYNGYALLAQGTSNYYQVTTEGQSWGWEAIQGGLVGDGTFHCYEIHIKLDTDQTDGIGRIWIDGVLREENTSVDWSNGVADRKDGIIYFTFENNQTGVQNSRPVYIDYDDMVVYNTTPPNQDADGNPYIGPLDAEPTYDSPIVEILTESQSTTAATITIIGTLVTDSALTGTGVDVNGVPATADDGAWDEPSEAWTALVVPLSLGANAVTATGTDSELQTDTDIKTDWITRTPPPSSGNVIYTGSMSGGSYR